MTLTWLNHETYDSLKVLRDGAELATLAVTDTLQIPASAVLGGEAQFLLHAALEVRASQPPASRIALRLDGEDAAAKADAARFFGINAAPSDLATAGRLVRYEVGVPPGGGTVVLH